MLSSIQYFDEVCVAEYSKIMEKLFQNPSDFDQFVESVEDIVKRLGVQMVKETLEFMDTAIRDSTKRKRNWVIEDCDQKQLLTSLGNVQFKKTLFAHKTNRTPDGKQEMCYLLDKALGFTENQRITNEVTAKIYREVVQTSYRRAGEVLGNDGTISKEAVKDLLHSTSFPKEELTRFEKKYIRHLYIDADEDHFNLQFQEKKGDLVLGENHRKNNGAITKLIYVYEGIEPETPGSKRNKLINPHFFCRGTGQDNKELWDEVYHYIETVYDVERMEQIYINADGGTWIKEGIKSIVGAKYVLDEFHLSKYIVKMCAHMMDTYDDARHEVYHTIKCGKKADFLEVVERLKWCTDDIKIKEKVDACAKYILANWSAAQRRLNRKLSGIVGSSTEGHVYHVLSKRMSTNPMGWSRHGGDQMGRLLEYSFNGGSMIELAKYQKKKLPMAAGAEELCEKTVEMIKDQRINTKFRRESGKYYEAITNTLSIQKRKQAMFYMNHWF